MTMKQQSPSPAPSSGAKIFWRSLESKADSSASAADAQSSDVTKRTIDAVELGRLKRRNFLTLSGAITALAGVEGCIRRPVEKILPYTDAPGDVTLGVPSHYATVTTARGEALGLLVNSYEGRPTKVEGNPDHPSSLGSSDMWAQAAVLDLYDPERAQKPSRAGVTKTYAQAGEALDGVVAEAMKSAGRGLRVLAPPTLSPTFVRLRERVLARFPEARFHSYAPVTDANAIVGTRIAFGQPLAVLPRFDQAKVIVSIDSDFLQTETGDVLASRQFATSRRMESAAGEMSRLYVIEPVMTVTGSNADNRLRLEARAIGAYLKALAAELGAQGLAIGAGVSAAPGGKLDVPAMWTKSVAKDLLANPGASLIVVGSRQPAAVHALACALNRALGNAGKTVAYAKPLDVVEKPFEDIKALAAEMASGSVSALVILGGNPVYDAPADAGFAAALGKVATSVCLSDRLDETASLCTWHIPRAHELESWGDAASRTGHYSIQQPLIAPLFGARTDSEVLGELAGETSAEGHALVRATAFANGFADENAWEALVQRGVGAGKVELLGGLQVLEDAVAAATSTLTAEAPAGQLEVVFVADNKLFDGSYANNSWLLELPDPVTRITWDNAALMAPSTAKALGLDNGDMVRITVGGASLDMVAWKQPGQAAGSIGLPLGWGRKKAGANADGAGFNVYPLRTSTAPHFAAAKLEKIPGRYKVSQTQDHDSMEGRPLAIDATLDEYKETPDFGQWTSPDLSSSPLWKPQDYSEGHQWGMVIDLSSCTGCNACVIACQSENNIPVVGKDQVARGREMHWIRIDRYYAGDEDEPEVAFQPIACQHCETAPCENVCPVNATAHSPEGLNDIAYNRCIGTRYCMNNCPYKVRRFNFLNFNLDVAETRKMQFNPSVSVRFRGVIEKCSYCVQRIQTAKISAKRDTRVLKDGDVVTACQQACPSQAITFGDINDKDSRVANAREIDRNYALLADVGTRPRTRFLGKIRNPNPEMKG